MSKRNEIGEKEEIAYLIVNFGGPRDLTEVEEFLVTLLTDQEVIQTPFPPFLHRLLFTKIAKKRAKVIAHDYATIGGKSPIYEDTEAVALEVTKKLNAPVLTFHRYLPKTHPEFLRKIEEYSNFKEIRVFPLFPQFSYATTGSIALWFSKNLKQSIVNKLNWIKSYPANSAYLKAFETTIKEELAKHNWEEKETILLFSAHGLPQEYVCKGDVYEKECRLTFDCLASKFPQALSKLCYQSQFGKKQWIRPYTNVVCEDIKKWGNGYKNVLVIPLSFTSDHIETLFEVEQQYVPVIAKQGFNVFRCPALNLRLDWIDAIIDILTQPESSGNTMLIRHPKAKCCSNKKHCCLVQN